MNESAHILVVDDNPATRYSTSRILRSAGWRVSEAETGEAGLAAAQEGVDLLVLDVNLPDIDGFTVCRKLRAMEATALMPILHLSATFVKSEHKVTGLNAGADGYLTHPVEPPVLIATVNAFLRTRQAEIELRQSEARFKSLFETALNGICVLNDELVFVNANPAMCQMLGLARKDIVGHSLAEYAPPDSSPSVAEMRQSLVDKGSWQGRLPLRRLDDATVHLEWRISVHTTPGLRLAIVSDISDRLQYEEDREQFLISERAARAEAEQANRLKDDFLATLSHELRTPLNAIVGWAQLLKLGGMPADDTAQGIEAIERNALAQAQMIADLLDVSRITTGKIRLEVEMLDPTVVIVEALTAILPTAEAKSIRITKVLDSRAAPISADPSRLQQVLWNLVNNAVKFTPKGGRVHITLQRINSHIEIRVADNGKGIAPDMLPHVFERFRQADSSSTREHGGLGLGLAITKQLVELHGGAIAVESPGEGQGATFIVQLPLVPAYSSEPLEDRKSAPPVKVADFAAVYLHGTRVLLVEDDADSRALLKRILTGCRAEVCEVDSVSAALEAIPTFKPEVVLSDLGMPGRDGIDLIREIRARGYTVQSLPAVALTAFARTEDRHRSLVAGFQVHLSKPVDPRELTAVIASLVGKTSEHRTAPEAAS